MASKSNKGFHTGDVAQIFDMTAETDWTIFFTLSIGRHVKVSAVKSSMLAVSKSDSALPV